MQNAIDQSMQLCCLPLPVTNPLLKDTPIQLGASLFPPLPMGESSHSDPSNDLAMDSVLPKAESLRDVSITSSMSTPEAEVEELDPDAIQAHKRKGGRKPVGRQSWRS